MRRPATTYKTATDEMLDEAARLNLGREQLAALRYAASIHRGTKSQKREADGIVARIRREILAGIEESVSLERARGDEVRDFNTAGAKRLSSRDGLLSLFQAGKLDAKLTGAGLAYRRAVEAEGRIGCASLLHARGDAPADFHVKAALQRAKLSILAAAVDRAVALELKHRPICLDTLRRVAGYGQSVRSLCAGGVQFAGRVEALIAALEIAARYAIMDPT